MFKSDNNTTVATKARFVVNDSVFAFEGIPNETGRIRASFLRWTGTGNTMCFMQSPHTGEGGTKPGSFPTIPAGMTVLEGTAARNFWEASRSAYLSGTPDPVGAYKLNAVTVNPTTGLVSVDTAHPFSGSVTVRATNTAGSDTEAVSIVVS
jgi:hypothetical protein